MTQKNTKKIALVLSSMLLMSQMGFADAAVADEVEQNVQEQVVKKAKALADAEGQETAANTESEEATETK